MINLPSYIKKALILLGTVGFIGCKSKLNEEQAQELIINTFKIPHTCTRLFNFGDYWYGNELNTFGEGYEVYAMQNFKISGYRYLANNEFIEISPRINTTPGGYYAGMDGGRLIFSFFLTEKTEPYIINTNEDNYSMNVGQIDFGEFQGLREINENEYEVEFSLRTSLTPFGVAYNKGILQDKNSKNQPLKLPTRNLNLEGLEDSISIDYKIRIYRYEKGWQISRDDIKKVNDIFN